MRRGSVLQIKDEIGTAGPGTAQITILPRTGQTIDGSDGVALNAPRASLIVYSDGENWQILS